MYNLFISETLLIENKIINFEFKIEEMETKNRYAKNSTRYFDTYYMYNTPFI